MRNVHYISAGAGSGKTYTLTDTLARHIAEGFCRPDEVMLTTFTVAAANEFREKARARLHEAGLTEEAIEMDGARIGTIHSVAQSLIERYWYRLGLSPNMTIIDDQAHRQHIDESLAAPATDKDLEVFRRVTNCFGLKASDDSSRFNVPDYNFWKRDLERIISIADNYDRISPDESLEYCNRHFDTIFNYTGTPSDATLKEQLKSVREYMQLLHDSEKASASVKNRIAPLLALRTDDAAYEFTVRVLSLLLSKTGIPDKLKNEQLGMGYVAACETLERSLRHADHATLLKDYAKRIFRLAKEWREQYTEYKRLNRLIDYNDMERYFLQLLDDGEVADDIRQTTRLVLVDEFQDCNPIQIRIFDRLSEIVERSVWVGDAKQSIYGFRNSDVEMVEAMTEALPREKENSNGAGCFRTTLPKSYRSREKLVKAANSVFTPIFGKEAGLDPNRTEEGVEHIPPLEIWQAAEDIHEAIADGVEGMIAENIPAGHIAILTRRNDEAQHITEALRRRGIRVAAVEPDICNYIEVQAVAALINYAVQRDDFSKAVILALLNNTPVEALLEERLKFLARADNTARWMEDNDLFRHIDCVVERNRNQSIAGFVESLIVELDFDNLINRWGSRDASRRRSHLESVLQLAEAYQTGSGASLGGFAHYLQQATAPERPFRKDPQAVSVLTYHKSKGLEWEHVIMTELSPDISDKRFYANNLFGVRMHRTGAPAQTEQQIRISVFPNIFGSSSIPASIEPALREALQYDAIRYRTRMEDARLLYVGFTRARDRLIAVQKLKTARDGSLTAVAPTWLELVGAANGGKIWSSWEENIPAKTYTGIAPADLDTDDDATALQYRRGEAPAHPLPPKYLQPSTIAPDADAPLPEIEIIAERGERITLHADARSSMADIGTTLHNILAICRPDGRCGEEVASRIIRRHGMESVITSPKQVADTAEWIARSLESLYGPARKVWHERPLRMWRDGQEINGSIDMIWETDRGCVIVDYKSFPGRRSDLLDRENEHYAGHYAPQLNTYAEAMETAGLTPIDTLVVYVVQGCIVRLKIVEVM